MSKKAIMISIKPKWVAKILNGKKTIEIRKTMPKCDLPIDVYIYCTKQNKGIPCENYDQLYSALKTLDSLGKVVAKFTLNKVKRFEWDSCGRDNDGYWLDNGERFDLKTTCLTYGELFDYVKSGVGYAWHISNLVIFDKPKELSEFEHYNLTEKSYRRFPHCDFNLTKAPQSWQFIEVE